MQNVLKFDIGGISSRLICLITVDICKTHSLVSFIELRYYPFMYTYTFYSHRPHGEVVDLCNGHWYRTCVQC